MYKLMTLAAALVVLALAPVLTGVRRDDGPAREMVGPGTHASGVRAAEPSQPDEALTCEWTCRACEPEQGCRQICTETGDCGSTCGVTAQCDTQHAWSEDACACVLR
jgi:hypothetical protein